ncbi:MAG: sensor histidine kinase [Kamptonema sp. SIO4C4]|nr:sensor histidine kinase [Kamptonema sp. SIO4C4]
MFCTLMIDTAIPCGLIITELLSNALKYAFPNQQQGEITLQFHQRAENLVLRFSDNGVELPTDFDLEESESLGLQLVVGLTEQLNGHLELIKTPGTTFVITLTNPHFHH